MDCAHLTARQSVCGPVNRLWLLTLRFLKK
nr:MAG TPA: hypothetical protein [Caudoviricetes sp.]